MQRRLLGQQRQLLIVEPTGRPAEREREDLPMEFSRLYLLGGGHWTSKLSSGRGWNAYSNGTDPCSHEHQSANKPTAITATTIFVPNTPQNCCSSSVQVWCQEKPNTTCTITWSNELCREGGGVATPARSRGNHVVRLRQFIVWKW